MAISPVVVSLVAFIGLLLGVVAFYGLHAGLSGLDRPRRGRAPHIE